MIKKRLTENDVTDERLFRQRRRFIQYGGLMALTGALSPMASAMGWLESRFTGLEPARNPQDLEPHDYKAITHYNNFYELGYGKGDPARNAAALKTDPWSVEISGECGKPGIYTLEDILKPHDFEERIYRFRCVEAWSMVIPWVGFPLSELIKRFEPTPDAKYIAFETIYDENRPLPGQLRNVLEWPYREGLRMDEAMHPLTMMATGIYGKPLLNQNGAPLRLVVPWKYGFKYIKSIVKIHFSKTQPETSWNLSAPNEYGFYANVNPAVDHPRWSQARERVIGKLFKQKTLPFNGYEEEVAGLYKGMDLRQFY